MTSKRQLLRYSAGLFGAILFLVALAGQFRFQEILPLGNPGDWDRFEVNLAKSTRSIDALFGESERMLAGRSYTDSEKSVALFDLVSRRGFRGVTTHTLFSNYLLFVLGKLVHPAFLTIYSPHMMLKFGSKFICSQTSYLLVTLAKHHDLTARHVGLFGHVVMEIWHDGKWNMYDPNFEVVPYDESGKSLSVSELSKREDLIVRYYKDRVKLETIVPIIMSEIDNTYMSYPAGSYFEWKTNVLLYFELVCRFLIWIIPALLVAPMFPVVVSSLRTRIQRRRSVSRQTL